MDLTTILELATRAGAGLLTVILCFVSWTLWGKLEEEQKYSRQRDEDTLKILTSISLLLNNTTSRLESSHANILAEIKRLHDTIMDHVLEQLEQGGK